MQLRRGLGVIAATVAVCTLVGCAADDPLTLDCLGNPTDEPVAAPPAPEEEIVRPDDRIVDLRGEERVEIEVSDNEFETRWLRVDPCTELVFVNIGANPHNVVPAAEGAFPRIDQEPLRAAPQSLVVTAPGDYPFYCSIHGTPTRGQTGYLVVGDG